MAMEVKDYLISENADLIEGLKKLNGLSGKAMTLFVVDSNGKVLGSLTDGDIRRGLIAGKGVDTPVSEVMHEEFTALRGEKIDVKSIRTLREKKLKLVPHLGQNGAIKELYDFSLYKSILPIDAVLMAGGKGERLRPMTLDTPKPLLKIGEKCIIDYNIEALARNGVTNISVTTNYLAEKINEHFAVPVAGVQVKCVKEPCRMGTIGSLTLVNDLENDTVLLMNSDLLTNINYEEMYLLHAESGADLTAAVIPYMVSVPYAIFRTVDNKVMGLEEKPSYNYYANAGIYMIKRERLALIPRGTYFDATDFIEAIIADGGIVRQFPINGTWIDIGSPNDFHQAQELMKQHNGLLGL